MLSIFAEKKTLLTTIENREYRDNWKGRWLNIFGRFFVGKISDLY